MDPASIKKYLVPAFALAALIVVVGLIIAGNTDAPAPKTGSASSHTSSEPIIKPGADTSDKGMVDTMPTDVPWTVLPGGLKYQDVKEGSGDTVSAGQRVSAHYTGWLAVNGQEFDSSRKRGQPIEFSLNGVVKGWSNGIPGMKVGGIRRLYIPSEMGYGQRGSGHSIPPNSDLVFEVKLVGFQ